MMQNDKADEDFAGRSEHSKFTILTFDVFYDIGVLAILAMCLQ